MDDGTPVAPSAEASAPVSGGESSGVPEASASASPSGVAAADSSTSWDGWDDWSGEVDALPDHLQESGGKIHSHLNKDFEARAAEFKDLQDVYSAIIREQEDPRVRSLSSERDTLRREFDAYKAQYGKAGEDLKSLQEEYNNFQGLMAREYADNFWDRHGDIKEDPEKRERFKNLLDPEGDLGSWDAEVAVQLLDLSEETLKLAVAAKKDGVSDKYALRIAQADAKERDLQSKLDERDKIRDLYEKEQVKTATDTARKAASQPRPAARLTNGATTDTRPEVRSPTVSDAKSLDEMRALASRRALRVHKGGR